MRIQEIPVDDLIPYSNNPRLNDGAVAVVAESIQRFGFKVPIVISADKVVATGHTRLKAAQRLGMKTVPCIIADDLTPEQIKAFRLADNKTAEYAIWDMEKLEQELAELAGMEIDMSAFDFKLPADIQDDAFDLDGALAAIDEPISQPGDVWTLGRHRLMCGDSTVKADMDKLMAGTKARLIVTDPPYNVAYEGGTEDKLKIINDSMSDSKFREFLTQAFKRMFESADVGAPIYVFHADSEGHNFRSTFKASGFKLAQCLIWVKNSLVLGRQDYQWRHEPILYGWKEGKAHSWYGDRNKDTVIEDDKISLKKAKKEDLVQMVKELQAKLHANTTTIYHDRPSVNAEHPTMKPVKLIGKLLENSGQRGIIVLDSFGGSGSTLMACEQSERICFTMEMDPKYADVIVKRWEQFTGLTAVKQGGGGAISHASTYRAENVLRFRPLDHVAAAADHDQRPDVRILQDQGGQSRRAYAASHQGAHTRERARRHCRPQSRQPHAGAPRMPQQDTQAG